MWTEAFVGLSARPELLDACARKCVLALVIDQFGRNHCFMPLLTLVFVATLSSLVATCLYSVRETSLTNFVQDWHVLLTRFRPLFPLLPLLSLLLFMSVIAGLVCLMR